METYTLHTNSHTREQLRALLPLSVRPTVVQLGDCGYEWNEFHSDGECPHPHVTVSSPTLDTIETLNRHGVQYVLDLVPTWGEVQVVSPHGYRQRLCASRNTRRVSKTDANVGAVLRTLTA